MFMAKTDKWYLERIIHLIAGTIILTSIALAYFFNKYWLILTAFVGFNLIVFSLTGFCVMANILTRFGIHSYACNCDDNCECC